MKRLADCPRMNGFAFGKGEHGCIRMPGAPIPLSEDEVVLQGFRHSRPKGNKTALVERRATNGQHILVRIHVFQTQASNFAYTQTKTEKYGEHHTIRGAAQRCARIVR